MYKLSWARLYKFVKNRLFEKHARVWWKTFLFIFSFNLFFCFFSLSILIPLSFSFSFSFNKIAQKRFIAPRFISYLSFFFFLFPLNNIYSRRIPDLFNRHGAKILRPQNEITRHKEEVRSWIKKKEQIKWITKIYIRNETYMFNSKENSHF